MTRILVPTDFSEPSLVAVRSGISLATTVGGVVLLLHVVEGTSVRCYPGGGLPRFLSDMIELGREYRRFRLDRQLIRRDFCEEAGWKLDALVPPRCREHVHTLVTVGSAVDEIGRVAEEQHADFILLGAPGKRRWRHLLHRTMADRVRPKILIPVITLDAEGLSVERDPDCGDVAGQCIGRGRASAHSAEFVGMMNDRDAAHELLSAEFIARPQEEAYDGLEPPNSPHPDSQGERGGRHVNKRSQVIGV